MNIFRELLRPLLRPVAQLFSLVVAAAVVLIGTEVLIEELASAYGGCLMVPTVLAAVFLLHTWWRRTDYGGPPSRGTAPAGPAPADAAPAAGRAGQLVVLWSDERPETDGTWTRALRVLVHVRRLPPAAAPLLHGVFLAVRLFRRLRRGLAPDGPDGPGAPGDDGPWPTPSGRSPPGGPRS